MKSGFRWCPHCGKPHSLADRACPVTGKPLDAVIHHRSTPQARTPFLGAVLDGKYRIIRPIGGGGMGMVFEAEHLLLKRLVAVKVVAGTNGAGSADALARLAREAKLVAAIHHPNICDVYDVGELANGGPYVVLEHLVGDTLATRMRGVKMRTAAVIEIFVQLLAGLAAAHRVHILHRDLKPQNIFLVQHHAPGPLVKILDFGLARDLSAPTKDRLTKPGRACGTVQYMSPEQLRAKPLDPRSDLFTIGVMLYEALTGRHPFAAPSQLELQTNILRKDPRPLRSFRPDVPPLLEQVIAWSMSRLPQERPSSALDLQRALISAFPQWSLQETTGEEEPASVTNPIYIPPSSSSSPAA